MRARVPLVEAWKVVPLGGWYLAWRRTVPRLLRVRAQVALPLETATVELDPQLMGWNVPEPLGASRNSTEPLGTGPRTLLTVAVTVTAWPTSGVVVDAVSAVVVGVTTRSTHPPTIGELEPGGV
jgi:hypothetical protein